MLLIVFHLPEIRRLARQRQSSDDQSSDPTVLLEKLTDWSDLSQDIFTNSQSAVEVLNDMLNYDKVESKSLQLELTVFSIWSLIERTWNEFQLQAKASKINYVLDFSGIGSDSDEENLDSSVNAKLPREIRDLRVIGDKARIAQCERNLISNALKFTPDNGSVTVRVGCQSTQTKTDKITLHSGETISFSRSHVLELSVKDTGAGMTKDQLEKVFSEGVQFNVNKVRTVKCSANVLP